MIEWICEICGKNCELEEIEATLYSQDHEHYELGLCLECLEK